VTRLLYDFTLTTPDSVFIEANLFDASGERTYIGSDTIALNASGAGIYSLAASPVTIGATNEYAEILVYADSSCTRLVTQLIVSPAIFKF